MTFNNHRVAILAPELTEEALIEALQARRFYSTADMNIALSFTVNLAPMGSEIAAGTYGFAIAAGDGDDEAFTTVQLIRNGVVLNEWTPNAADPELDGNITTTAGDYYYVKVTQADGDEAISSPVFIVGAGGGTNDYAGWISGFTGLGRLTGFGDDPDRDGIGNGLESYLGTDPGVANSGLAAASVSGSSFTFTHTESNQIPGDVSARYEWSIDLANWFGSGVDNGAGFTVTIAEDSRADNSAPDNDVVTATATPSGNTSELFVRLRADLQTP